MEVEEVAQEGCTAAKLQELVVQQVRQLGKGLVCGPQAYTLPDWRSPSVVAAVGGMLWLDTIADTYKNACGFVHSQSQEERQAALAAVTAAATMGDDCRRGFATARKAAEKRTTELEA